MSEAISGGSPACRFAHAGYSLTKHGLEPVTVKETDHYKVMREFCDDTKGLVEMAIEE